MLDETTLELENVRKLIGSPTNEHNLTKALEICQKLRKKEPNNPEIFFEICSIYSKQKQAQKTIQNLKKLIEEFPDHLPGRYLLVRWLSDVGKRKEAILHANYALLKEAQSNQVQVNLNNLEAISVSGTDAIYTGQWEKAKIYYKNIIHLLEKYLIGTKPNINQFNPHSLPHISERQIYPIIYLPVEVKAREFEAKVLLALAAAEAGFHVVIGRTWVLSHGQFSDIPAGIIIFKTLNAMDAKNMAIAQVNGKHIIAALDEEAFGRSSSIRALKLNVESLAVTVADIIMVQGKKHLDSWSEFFGIEPSKIFLTGNPKTDLFTRINKEKKNTRSKNNILFCTMSGNVNPKGRSFARTIQQTLISGSASPSENMIRELSRLMYDTSLFEIDMIQKFTDLICATAKHFSDCNIIVRPHPIENKELWVKRFKDNTNVKIESEGALTKWLEKCDVMIHIAGCGSGVEAALQGVPAISFKDENIAEDPGVGLSSSLNIKARNNHEAIEQIDAILNDRKEINQYNDLESYIWKSEDNLNSRIVINTLKKLYAKNSKKDSAPLNELRNLRERRKSSFDLKPFHLQKFPQTSAEEVNELILKLCNKFEFKKTLKAKEIEDGLFILENLK